VRLGPPGGQSIGRPKALTPDQARQIRALHTTGGGVPELMATFGVSRATIYRALSEAPIPTMTKEHLP
jgi:DNA invertase Pin-like site-specific DNA recombinase